MTTKALHKWVLLVFAMLASVIAQGETQVLSPDQNQLQLGPSVEYLEDPKGTLSIDTISSQASGWQPSAQDVLSFGYTASAYWVRFSLKRQSNDDARTRPYVLEIAYPVLDEVDVYVFQGEGPAIHYAMGDQLPYAQRPIDHPNFAIPLEVSPSGVTRVYLRVQSSSSTQIPLTLYQNQKLVEKSYETAVSQALFYGAMLVMVFYNLLIFISIRDVSYLHYVMMVLSMTALLAGMEGLSFKYLWPEVTGINDPLLVISLAGVVSFSGLFFRSFLTLPHARPRLSRVALFFAFAPAVTAVAALFLPYRPMMLITLLLAMTGILAGAWIGFLRWRDGFHGARLFNIAWSCLLVAGFLLAVNKLGLVPRDWFSEHIAQLGAGAQAILLSFAMAHRMTYERRMREQAQQESVAAQQQMLNNQIRANEDLDRIVRERTEELEKTNAKLKEISATDGLTNLLNRRAFEEAFLTEYKRAYRDKSSLAVLMIDLDHFKLINDQHGHPFGDLCLIRTAEVIRDNLRRPSDIAARYGGEEFILLLPNTDTQGAVCVAKNILESLSQTLMDDGERRLTITASIGVAARVPQDQVSRETLLKGADQNLYAAKESGRNRVEWQVSPADEL
ncbi:MAG: hypothetical protein CL583_00905 [Alteromonadaceae bacterium]|nr:hypothetical protein [Alteromonadaceae bacterium]